MISVTGSKTLVVSCPAGPIAKIHSTWINLGASADTMQDASALVSGDAYIAVPAPAAGTINTLKNLSVSCSSGVAAISVYINDAGNQFPLASAVLTAGQMLVYEDGKGWQKVDADGAPLSRADKPNDNPMSIFHTQPWTKPSVGTQVAGSGTSLWRATGLPIQGAIPAAAAACSNATAGAMVLAGRTGTQKRRLKKFSVFAATANQTFFLEDRLAHMGGLNGTLTTAQTVNLDLSTLGNNIAARKGADDYSEVEWFLEWYTATGATVVTPTVNVTYADDTTGNCNVWVLGATALPASVAASRRYQIISATGKGIKKVNSVTLLATTGTAGSFGVTAVRELCSVCSGVAYREEEAKFDKNNAPPIEDEACLAIAMTVTVTSTGVASGTLVQDVSEA